ncbi:MAG: septation protein SpoVG family protein [Simkaniaceae bacterium]|nr:septation protein SpoVG family protein [Simkaniaceae bacterium]
MKIKKVEIVPVKPCNGLIGFAHVFFEEGLYLGSIGIFTKRDGDGYRLTYPTRRVGENNITIFHPINSECSKKFEKAVFQEAERVFSMQKF